MRVALDISSTKSDHRFRGIGTYTQKLWDELKIIARHDKSQELVTFNKRIPTADIYHFPAFNPFFFSFPFGLLNKSIITIHDLIPLEYPQHYPAGFKGSLKWLIQRQLLKKTKMIISDSNYASNSIQQITGISKDKIKTVYLAANDVFKKISDNQSLTKALQLRLKLPNKFVLYVGDFNWNKNIMMLSTTCVEQKIPLVVVGRQAINEDIDHKHPWNKELAAFQEFAKHNADLIFRLGYLSEVDLITLYNLAFAYVQPSITEGFGLPVLEAMACGCLVLSSSGGSLPEIAGDAALYFNPSNKAELKKQLEFIWDPSSNKAIEKYHKYAIKQAAKFSWKKTALQTWDVYKTCHANK